MLRAHFSSRLITVLALGGVCAAATLVAAQTPSTASAPTGLSRLRDGIILFRGASDRWVWVHATGIGEKVYEGGPNRAPRILASGAGWSGLAVDGSRVWLTRQVRASAELLHVDPGGGEPKVVADGLATPTGLFAQDGKVYWLENRPPGTPAFSFLPTLGWTCVLRVREANGTVRTLTEWPAGEAEGPDLLPQDILGKVGEELYLRIRRPASTELVRVSCKDGSAERVAVERGLQRAVLHEGMLCWTALSNSSDPASNYLCVRSASPGGEPRVIADWLPGDGTLLSWNRDLLYAQDSLYRLTGKGSSGAWLDRLPRDRVVSDGIRLVLLKGDAPAVHSVRGL